MREHCIRVIEQSKKRSALKYNEDSNRGRDAEALFLITLRHSTFIHSTSKAKLHFIETVW